LGIIVAGFSIYSLIAASRPHLEKDHPTWLVVAGFISGILGGAYGMNGPPLAIYGALRRWPPEYFRATLQAYFFPASIAGMAGYSLAGLWTPAVNHFYLVSLPGVVIAIFLGRGLNRRMATPQFLTYVYAGLIAIGVVLLLQAMVGWSKVLR